MLGGFLQQTKAQTVVEFTIAMVACCVILYFMVILFRWGMMDMAGRRYDHDVLLKNESLTVKQQVSPNFHQVEAMDFSLGK